MKNPQNADVDLDLEITKVFRRTPGDGAWVFGTINGSIKFNALVFAEHAECETYELGRSKISKLWLQRISDKKTLFNFDRGLDIPASDVETQVIVDFLVMGLAGLVMGT